MADRERVAGTAGDQHPPEGIDISVPSIARVYDYALFGKDNYEVDRKFGTGLITKFPDILWVARMNRAFLWRAVRYLAEEAGIRQFLDNGSGLPTRDNVHQVAQRVDPSARVAYIDNDPIVLAHGRALLAGGDPAGEGATTVITADMAHTEEILANPDVRRLIDLDQPVGVLYLAVLHGLPNEAGPHEVVARMMDAVPSGSYLGLSHLASDDEEVAASFTEYLNAATPWGQVRRPADVARFFDALEVVEPGLGDIATWRLDLGPSIMTPPEGPDDVVEWPPHLILSDRVEKSLWQFGGVARKP